MVPPDNELNGSDPDALENPSALCVAQAAIETYASLSSVLWTTAIAATLYQSVFMRKTADEVKSSIKWYYVACYGFPLLITIIPFTFGGYGPAGAWCWIKERYIAMRIVGFYLPLILAIIFNAVVYTFVVRLINRTYKTGADQASAKQIDNTTRKLRVYPFILLIVWLPAMINRTYELSTGEQSYSLFLIQQIFSSSQGMWNAMVYGFSRGVREALGQSLHEMCPALCPNRYQREIMKGVQGVEQRQGGFWRNDSIGNVRNMPSGDSATFTGMVASSQGEAKGGSARASRDSVDFNQIDITSAEAITNTPQLPNRGARVDRLSGATASSGSF